MDKSKLLDWVIYLLFWLGGFFCGMGLGSSAHAQYYYNPTPPTYHQYPRGVESRQYQMDVHNYLWQKAADDEQRRYDDEQQRTRRWYNSPGYDDPWGYKTDRSRRRSADECD